MGQWPIVTSLSTLANGRFASFFNRVKKQVGEHWHPEDAYRRRDPTGTIFGRQKRYTELRIQLNPDGRLTNIALMQPSGLEFLDDEAIEAFKAAQPFANPPRGCAVVAPGLGALPANEVETDSFTDGTFTSEVGSTVG